MSLKPFSKDNFEDYIKNYDFEKETWVYLYKSISLDDGNGNINLGFSACLVTDTQSRISMKEKNYGWESLDHPNIIHCYSQGEEEISYKNWNPNILPLCINQTFYGEILQEMALFLRLELNMEKNIYFVHDDNGEEIEVVRILEQEITIRKTFLKAFMAAKQMHLLLLFDFLIFSPNIPYKNNDEYMKEDRDYNTSDLIYTKASREQDSQDGKIFTKYMGKKLFKCLSLTKENISPFSIKKQYETFIIKGDAVDNAEEFTCNPKELADFFGKNPDAPNYLTPVFFKKEVLQKYYSDTDSFEVKDGHIKFKNFWLLSIDNDHKDYVCVYLGDLGDYLPFEEQKYWKSFNIGTEGKKISHTNYKRSFLAEFSEPSDPAFLFKNTFKSFQKKWHEKLSWYLFLPLEQGDQHHFSSLRCMIQNTEQEFDHQILSLTKLTIDSINVKKLQEILNSQENKSIILLAEFAQKTGVDFNIKELLQSLQGIRSTSVAHRKGTNNRNFMKILNTNHNTLSAYFDEVLRNMTTMFKALENANHEIFTQL